MTAGREAARAVRQTDRHNTTAHEEYDVLRGRPRHYGRVFYYHKKMGRERRNGCGCCQSRHTELALAVSGCCKDDDVSSGGSFTSTVRPASNVKPHIAKIECHALLTGIANLRQLNLHIDQPIESNCTREQIRSIHVQWYITPRAVSPTGQQCPRNAKPFVFPIHICK